MTKVVTEICSVCGLLPKQHRIGQDKQERAVLYGFLPGNVVVCCATGSPLIRPLIFDWPLPWKSEYGAYLSLVTGGNLYVGYVVEGRPGNTFHVYVNDRDINRPPLFDEKFFNLDDAKAFLESRVRQMYEHPEPATFVCPACKKKTLVDYGIPTDAEGGLKCDSCFWGYE